MQRLFPEITERAPMLFSDIATAIEQGEVDAGVLIHEGRFLYAQRGLELVADLGLEWEKRSSLPLPLGGIMMHKELHRETHTTFQTLLRESIEFAFKNPLISRHFIKDHAQEMADDVIEQHIALFVNDYSLSLGEDGRAAIEILSGSRG